MAEVVSMILSPFIEEFFKKLASGEFKDFFQSRKLSERLLKKLKTAFLTVNAVVEDAEELVVTKPAVKEWLDDLKDAVYDAEHFLDEIATEALQSELDAKSPFSAGKVLKSTALFHNSSVEKIEAKVREVLDSLDDLIARKDAIGLKEGLGARPSDRIETSGVDESDIFGRDHEKQEIIKMLFSDDACDNEMGVVAIVGMGGLGKTTLAQLVYNDDSVKQHFNCCAWVCVSDQFDPFRITKLILETVVGSTSDIKDLEQLQKKLKEELIGKKFLIVLDDVWNENYVQWEKLSKPFKSRVKGSKIVVTTRILDVASTMRSSSIYPLKELGDEDCWALFTKHAFNNYNSEINSQLKDLGKQIVKKCDGLPLAIKTIGALLRSKSDKEWNKILKSELWDLPLEKINIILALKLSYKYLPSYVKRCFAYCSIFPKDYIFEKDSIILLWMGEGFLQKCGGKTIEEVGDDYFYILVSRSLFQQSSNSKSSFIMHDLVNDLATLVSRHFIMRLDDNYSNKKLDKVRHLSYGMEDFDGFKKFKFLCKAKSLRTFLPLKLQERYMRFHLSKRIIQELLPMLKCLRVLSLSNYKNITEIPNLVGNLKHLRYLDLSFTKLQKLPDSICGLFNLQVLNLSWCEKLVALPKEMWKLVNLRHLDIMKTNIKDMPMQLGKLECLQTLTSFVIGKNGGCSIVELRKLKNLQGSLTIVGLQNIESAIDVRDASLRNKQGLNELKLEWDVDIDIHISRSQNLILNNLRPYTNLRKLYIYSYPGRSLSNWLGDTSFSKLVSIKLEECRDCMILPPLGQQPSLEILSIIGFNEVVSVGHEFYCTNVSSVTPFKALKDLTIWHLEKWEKWVLPEVNNGVEVFCQLQKLCIESCPKLVGSLPIYLPSLVELKILGCPQLVTSLPRTMILRELELNKCKVLLENLPIGLRMLETSGLEELKFNGLPSTIEILIIKDCGKLEFLREGMTKSDNSIQELSINQCSSSVSLYNGNLPFALKELRMIGCDNLVIFPEGIINSHSCMEKLYIQNCSTLKSFSKGSFPFAVKSILIENCERLEFLSEEMMTDSCLQYLFIGNCHALKFLSKGGFPCALKSLLIDDCSKLEFLSEKMMNTCLRDLSIYRCDALKSFAKGGFPSTLEKLSISKCENFEFPRNEKFPFLKSLDLSSCNSLKTLPLDLFPKLYKLSIQSCGKLELFEVAENYDRDLVIVDMLISNCPNFMSWPKGGLRTPKLTSFNFYLNVPKIFPILSEGGSTLNLQSVCITYSHFVRWMEWGWENFPSLREMYILSEDEDSESFPKGLLLPSSLTSLTIDCPANLKSLEMVELQHLRALERLEIYNCPKLKYMPKKGLPASVSYLRVGDCSLLAKQWQSKKGKEWSKIATVEQIWINGQLIE